MLAKLLRNKIWCSFLLFVIFFVVSSCSKKPANATTINTEILCNNTIKILVKFARASDIAEAIQKANYDKKMQGTSETYTAIKLRDGRSFRVEKIPPEDLIKCVLRESKMRVADPGYVRHF